MATQSFRRINIDINDTLYSKIIRFGHQRCVRCKRVRELQCAHIMGRGRYNTRFLLTPIKNGIPLCSDCHSWFDSKTSKDILFDERLQKIPQRDNRWYWLVSEMGYTWQNLIWLYHLSESPSQIPYSFKKKEITQHLKAELERLENDVF